MSDQPKPSNPSASALPFVPKPIKIIHEKGAQYRVYHADGAWGVISHNGNVQLDFCVERPPTPSGVIQPVHPDGNPTGEQTFLGLGDQNYFNMVRDFQCSIVLSFAAAVQVRSVLDSYIAATKPQMDAALEQIKQQK
ncbi:MAG TPA: hypothetical protein VGH42_10565 [Verrucomicrobiae bacterium]